MTRGGKKSSGLRHRGCKFIQSSIHFLTFMKALDDTSGLTGSPLMKSGLEAGSSGQVNPNSRLQNQ